MMISKNNQIIAIKLMAQIVSTYHMTDVLAQYGPQFIAIVASLSLGLGEYKISQEYAVMSQNAKLKRLMLYTLIGLSGISMLANIESFARFVQWNLLTDLQTYYISFAGFVYSISMPAIIVTTSFIKLKDGEKPERNESETKIEAAHAPAVSEKVTPIRRQRAVGGDSNQFDSDVQNMLNNL